MSVFTCQKCGWSGESSRCRPCHRKANATWKLANRDRLKAQKQRNEPARRRRAWASDPERRRQRYRERTAFYRAGDVTTNELRAIFAAAGGRCCCCGVPVKARFNPTDPRGFDHIVPRAAGGRHTATNLRLCCHSCNSKLSDKKATVRHAG